jgi:hypothetical protein
MLRPSAAATDPAAMGSGWRRNLPGQRLGVRAWVRSQLPATLPTCLQEATSLPAPSPLKRGVARSRVAAAIVVVLGHGYRVLGTGNPRVQLRKGTCGWR